MADESEDMRVQVSRALGRRLCCPWARLQQAIAGREVPCWVDEHGGHWVNWDEIHVWWWDRVPGAEQDRFWDSDEAVIVERPTRTRRRASSS
jgi:hypothetical protein